MNTTNHTVVTTQFSWGGFTQTPELFARDLIRSSCHNTLIETTIGMPGCPRCIDTQYAQEMADEFRRKCLEQRAEEYREQLSVIVVVPPPQEHDDDASQDDDDDADGSAEHDRFMQALSVELEREDAEEAERQRKANRKFDYTFSGSVDYNEETDKYRYRRMDAHGKRVTVGRFAFEDHAWLVGAILDLLAEPATAKLARRYIVVQGPKLAARLLNIHQASIKSLFGEDEYLLLKSELEDIVAEFCIPTEKEDIYTNDYSSKY